MTVQSPPAYLQNGSHSAALFRQAMAAAWQEGGPLQPNELWVAAQSTPNMSVQVGAGRAVIQGSQVSAPGLLPSGTGLFTSQAMYYALNDAAVTVTISAADPTNPRIDVVYIAVQDSFYSGSTNTALVGVVTGTPAPSPVAPAAPANSEILATVAVAANATSVTNGVITNKVSPAAPIGQPVDVQTLAQLNQWSPLSAGTYADVVADSTSSNDGLWRWNGARWSPLSGLVPIIPSSLTNGTWNADGSIAVSGSRLNLGGIFNQGFDTVQIIGFLVPASGATIFGVLRNGGADITANYGEQLLFGNGSTATAVLNPNGTGSWQLSTLSGVIHAVSITLMRGGAAASKVGRAEVTSAVSNTAINTSDFGLFQGDTSAYDGLGIGCGSVAGSTSMTGTIRVFGVM